MAELGTSQGYKVSVCTSLVHNPEEMRRHLTLLHKEVPVSFRVQSHDLSPGGGHLSFLSQDRAGIAFFLAKMDSVF